MTDEELKTLTTLIVSTIQAEVDNRLNLLIESMFERFSRQLMYDMASETFRAAVQDIVNERLDFTV